MVSHMTRQPQPEKQSSIEDHDSFNSFVSEGLRIGAHVVASKSHGKTRMLFSVASELMKQENVRVIAFDGTVWVFGMSKIPVFNVSEHDITASNRRNVDTIEKYSLQNENFVKLALARHKDLLFNLRCRAPSKRAFFVRFVINYLDSIQRKAKETSPDHENSKAIAYFIEESQNVFSSRNSASAENEVFLTVFNEGRNYREGFFTSSQRLTDFSKTIRSKQIACIGKLSGEDISSSLKRLEKLHGIDFCNLKPRHWFYEGKVFISPEFRQVGKPFIVNQQIKQKWLDSLPKHKTLAEKIANWFKAFQYKEDFKATSCNDNEDSEFDSDDIDRDMDEMPDDSLVYEELFDP
jgi:hypothetical protein